MSTSRTEPSYKDLEVRIHRGANHFDSLKKTWAKTIPVRQIDLSDPRTSPAAWVLGPDWDEKVTSQEAYDLGLDFSLIRDHTMADLATRMWRQQITVRRAKKSPRTTKMVAESA